MPKRVRAIRFCWPRRVPASTSSEVTNTEAKFSSISSTNCNRRTDMAQRLKTDWILFATVLVMVSFGVLILHSASSIMAQLRYGSTWHFVTRQVAWAAVSIVAMMTLKRTAYRKFQSPAVAFGAISVALLLLAVVYLVDTAHHRWLHVGPLSLQPS